ncbi:protein vav-like isoform X3 [Artemia franciscana]|uniref:protein vav-like isoform X3 n=1 Tax=Artemia franciscana TaxID=6661 RepID=UPI0032DA9144
MSDILWKECAEWFLRCDVISTDHPIFEATAEVVVFAQCLRDGVLLCHLLHKIDPKTMDLKNVCLRPHMAQFLCLKNIRYFINCCRAFYDIKEADLFEPLMLYDYTDFGKVLQTLSKLSHSARFTKKQIRGFPANQNHSNVEEESIYRHLEDFAGDDHYSVIDQPTIDESEEKDYYHLLNLQADESVYHDLCTFKAPIFPVQPVEKRDYSIRELVETEKNFIEALNLVKRYFVRPLSTMLSEDDKKTIFFGIKEIAEIHIGFHSDLCQACSLGAAIRISDIFLQWKEKFLIYGEYCSNLPKAHSRLDEACLRNEMFSNELTKCQQEAHKGHFKLKDLLAVPMQRILKYHLLLKELIKHTQQTHEEYSGLEKAYNGMLDVAEYINEVKRDNETIQIINDIQASISDLEMPEGTTLKDYGRLLRDGEIKIKCHDENNRIKPRYIFVFDKVLLMCKSTKKRVSDVIKFMNRLSGTDVEHLPYIHQFVESEQYIFKHSLPLQHYRVEDPPVRKVTALGRESRWTHQFILAHRQSKNAYTLFAKTEEMKKKWIRALYDALDHLEPAEIAPNMEHLFEMNTFEKPQNCIQCSRLLKGVFYQGYKCSKCGLSCHKSCLVLVKKCGTRPPELPPRPLSVSYPSTAVADDFRALSPTLRVMAPGPPLLNNNNNLPESPTKSNYVNLHLEEYPWYGGEMDRDVAASILSSAPNGTFLLRHRPPRTSAALNGDTGYALSLKTGSQVKHMKVCACEDKERGPTSVLYYLSESRRFRSIVELVQWYEDNSLSESFSGLQAVLERPWRRIYPTAIARYDYPAPEPNLLSLKRGDIVIILSKEGDTNGWWKGQIANQAGYFPKHYVREGSFN